MQVALQLHVTVQRCEAYIDVGCGAAPGAEEVHHCCSQCASCSYHIASERTHFGQLDTCNSLSITHGYAIQHLLWS